MLRSQHSLLRSAQVVRATAFRPAVFLRQAPTPLMHSPRAFFHVSQPRRTDPAAMKAAFLKAKAEREAKAKAEAAEAARKAAEEEKQRREAETKEMRERMRGARFMDMESSGAEHRGGLFGAAAAALNVLGDHVMTSMEERMELTQAPALFMETYLEKFPDEQEDRIPVDTLNKKVKKFFDAKMRALSGEMELDEEGNPIKHDEDTDTEYSDLKDLVWTPRQDDRWEQTMDSVMDGFRNTDAFRSLHRARRKLETSEDPLLSRLREFRDDLEERIEQTRESLETGEGSILMRLRSGSDMVSSGDAESSIAEAKFLKLDPDFDAIREIRNLSEFMIPVVIRAHRKPHIPLLTRVLDGAALSTVSAEIRGRLNTGQYLDPAITDIRDAELVEMSLDMEEEPVMQIMFQCGHVNCVRDAEGKIVEGSPTNFVHTLYIWHLKRNMADLMFPWSIINFQSHTMQRLV